MNEKEKNRLEEWAGIKQGIWWWSYPDGLSRRDRPNFNSLDACFRWLVPMLDFVDINRDCIKEAGWYAGIISKERLTGFPRGNYFRFARAETPAQALCDAVLKLIETTEG